MKSPPTRRTRAVGATAVGLAAIAVVATACQPIVPYSKNPKVSMSSGTLGQYSLLAGAGFKAGTAVRVVEQYVTGGTTHSAIASSGRGGVDAAGRFNLNERLNHKGAEHFQVYGTSWSGHQYIASVNVYTR